MPQPSEAVLRALKRRSQTGIGGLAGTSAAKQAIRIEWFIKEVSDKINFTMKQRVRIATELVKSQVVKNISKAVGKSGGRVTERSKPGEFPRADTTQLMKSIFGDTRTTADGAHEGYVGTPLDYGVILELYRDRSFLRRTLDELRTPVTRILSGPIR